MVRDATRDFIKKAIYTCAGKQCKALQGKHESERTFNLQ